MSEPVYAAFDLETTGLSGKTDEIIEIGAVRFTLSGGVEGAFETLVDPGRPIPLAIQRLCGITDRDVAGAPAPGEAVAQLAEFTEGAVLVAHSAAFDLGFCAVQLPGVFAHRPCLDTLELVRILLPGAASHSLPDLALQLGLIHEAPHRALSDAIATRLLLLHLLERLGTLPPPLRTRMRELCQGAEAWPVASLLARHPEPGAPGPPVAPGPSAPPAAVAPPPARPRDGSPAAFHPVQVAALLGPEGPLARSSPEFELRETQQQMAIAVGQALRRSRHLLVEAGTGIGKSYAYLVPAREWAALTGERVVVSTHTIPLQEQLVEHDLPALEAQRPLGLRVALLKGRGHYLSLRRLERWLRLPSTDVRGRVDLDVLRFKLRCLVWAAQTARGDRAELRLAGPDLQLWDRVASTTDDCLGPACHNWRSGACFMVQARLTAQQADLLVVNHALLLADGDSGGSVLPAFTRLVVDEAHHLDDAATASATQRLALGGVLQVLDRLPALGQAEVVAALQGARQAAITAFGDLKGFLAEGSAAGERPRTRSHALDDRTREAPAWERPARSLGRAVGQLQAAARQLHQLADAGPAQPGLWPQADNAARECHVAAEALETFAGHLALALTPDPQGEEMVAWVELGPGEQAAVRLAPVDVGSRLAARLFDPCETAVLTSATLAVAGSFAYVRQRLHLAESEELVLTSEFDYLHQALLVLPGDMPAPDDPGRAAAVAGLVAGVARALGGRTLVLFTAYASLRAVHAALPALVGGEGIVVAGQGIDGSRNQLLRAFRRHPRTVLLGTSSFWEGIDIPGDALQCVIIDRLPFPVPTDPLYRARARHRRDPFRELALPQAVLRLRQGFGRLLRTTRDRGAVVLADSRLTTRDYGPTFLEALPRAGVSRGPAASVPEVVERFIRQGVVAGSLEPVP